MGKATIISHLGDGQYSVNLEFNSEQKDKQLASIDAHITNFEAQLLDLAPGSLSYSIVELQITSLNKQKTALDTIPDEESMQVWCADLSETLSGEVGTIEVPGEKIDVNIQPGFDGNSTYDRGRDGQLTKIMTQSPEQAYFNASQLPGWQKWKPTFRYAIISNLSGNECTITFETTTSTQQSLSINQTDSIDNVDIDYMDCDGVPFEDGNSVIVMFTGQDWSQPKVIGFKDNPKPCNTIIYVTYDEYCIVYDLAKKEYAPVPLDSGSGDASFPVVIEDISDWLETVEIVYGSSPVNVGTISLWSNTVDPYDIDYTPPGGSFPASDNFSTVIDSANPNQLDSSLTDVFHYNYISTGVEEWPNYIRTVDYDRTFESGAYFNSEVDAPADPGPISGGPISTMDIIGRSSAITNISTNVGIVLYSNSAGFPQKTISTEFSFSQGQDFVTYPHGTPTPSWIYETAILNTDIFSNTAAASITVERELYTPDTTYPLIRTNEGYLKLFPIHKCSGFYADESIQFSVVLHQERVSGFDTDSDWNLLRDTMEGYVHKVTGTENPSTANPFEYSLDSVLSEYLIDLAEYADPTPALISLTGFVTGYVIK